jgi:hypothetical protein
VIISPNDTRAVKRRHLRDAVGGTIVRTSCIGRSLPLSVITTRHAHERSTAHLAVEHDAGMEIEI